MSTDRFWLSDERGSAVLEFLLFGLLLQITSLTLFLQISSVQASQLVAESIARHGMRSFIMDETDPAVTAAQLLRDFDIKGQPNLDFSCSPNCLSSGSTLRLTVSFNSAIATSVFVR